MPLDEQPRRLCCQVEIFEPARTPRVPSSRRPSPVRVHAGWIRRGSGWRRAFPRWGFAARAAANRIKVVGLSRAFASRVSETDEPPPGLSTPPSRRAQLPLCVSCAAAAQLPPVELAAGQGVGFPTIRTRPGASFAASSRRSPRARTSRGDIGGAHEADAPTRWANARARTGPLRRRPRRSAPSPYSGIAPPSSRLVVKSGIAFSGNW